MTEIGEKGINLSGGQKQRVSLARAVYQDRNVYLLDDPLSAVDAHVGKHIFDKVIGPTGVLATKTRILVTHGLHFLKQVDQIIVMKEGRVTEVGTYKQLLANRGAFAEFLEEYVVEEANKHHHRRTTSNDSEGSEELITELLEELGKADPNVGERLKREISEISGSPAAAPVEQKAADAMVLSPDRMISSATAHSPTRQLAPEAPSSAATKPPAPPTADDGKKLIQAEKSETGKVKMRVYVTYIESIGYALSAIFLAVYVASNVSGVGSNLWLADWSDETQRSLTDHNITVNLGTKLGVYTALGLGQGLCVRFPPSSPPFQRCSCVWRR